MLKKIGRIVASTLACVILANSVFAGLKVSARSKEESDAYAGTTDYTYYQDLGDNQPWVHSYRLDNSLLSWTPAMDAYAEYNPRAYPASKQDSTVYRHTGKF